MTCLRYPTISQIFFHLSWTWTLLNSFKSSGWTNMNGTKKASLFSPSCRREERPSVTCRESRENCWVQRTSPLLFSNTEYDGEGRTKFSVSCCLEMFIRTCACGFEGTCVCACISIVLHFCYGRHFKRFSFLLAVMKAVVTDIWLTSLILTATQEFRPGYGLKRWERDRERIDTT